MNFGLRYQLELPDDYSRGSLAGLIGQDKLLENLGQFGREEVLVVYNDFPAKSIVGCDFRIGTIKLTQPEHLWLKPGSFAISPKWIYDVFLTNESMRVSGDTKLMLHTFSASAANEAETAKVVSINPIRAYVFVRSRLKDVTHTLAKTAEIKEGDLFYWHREHYD